MIDLKPGILGYGLYLPDKLETTADLIEQTGLSRDALANLGLSSRYRPAAEDQPVTMAAKASRQAMERAGNLPPGSVDLVLWTGEEYKDYIAQTASIRLQEEVGCRRAWAFDLVGQGVTLLHGLRVARDMMYGDQSLKTVLLAGGTRNLDLVDPKRPETRFLLSYSASGAALILRRDHPENELLEIRLESDPAMADEVYVPGGGTSQPFTAENIEGPEMFFQVPRPEGLKSYLDGVWPRRLTRIAQAVLTDSRPDYLALRHLSLAARAEVLHGLGLEEHQSLPLDQTGHHGSNDLLLSLELGLERGRISPGDLVALVSGGIGFNYGAALIRWG